MTREEAIKELQGHQGIIIYPSERMDAALTDSIDDCAASYEAVARYNIACPYARYSDCLNDHENNEYDTAEYKEGCVRCKMAWLERVYDTYPSDDGIWEVTE